MRQRGQRRVYEDAAVVEHFLKFIGRLLTSSHEQIGLAARIDGVEEPTFFKLGRGERQVVGRCGLKNLKCLWSVAALDLDVRTDSRQPVTVERRVCWKLLFQFF